MYRYGQEEIDAMARVVRSGQWFRYGEHPRHGHEAAKFEQEFASAFKTKHCCFLTNGTAALMCAYAGLGLGPGDEVITPGYTWVASALAPLTVGVIPVLAECDETLTLSPEAVEKAITPRTKAINPVHIAGLACDMDALRDIAKRKGLVIIEDACQCDGGLWKNGEALGTLGQFGTYSFNYFKVISCGEGGAFVTDDAAAFEKAIVFHDCGCNFFGRQPTIPMFAGNLFRGNEIMAAMMREQLKRLPGIINDLHSNRTKLETKIKATGGLTIGKRNGDRTGTGGAITLKFANREIATAFSKAYNAAVTPAALNTTSWLPIDSGRHVYANWEILMESRGSYHPGLDPFKHPANAASNTKYHKDMLPRTLALVSTHVLVTVNPDWTDADIERVATIIRNAAATAASPR